MGEENNFFDYKIPEEIINAIPETFWKMFADELTRRFGTDIFDIDPVERVAILDFLSGSVGWYHSFEAACKVLEMADMYEYYNKLAWWEADIFSDEINSMLLERFRKGE